jgi:SAM-dependent methyltransferase
MRLGVIADSPEEREALDRMLVPTPLLETQRAFTLARVVMVATQLGVFDALAAGPATAAEVAERCRTHPVATAKLLIALTGAGYVQVGSETYDLTPTSRTWLVRESPHSLVDKMAFQFYEWDLVTRSADYVRTGLPLELHERMDDEQWALYQRGMRAVAITPAERAAQVIEVPPGARTVLDVGGSHGYYSVALCRRHPALCAVVLDLPKAVKHAAPLLAAEGMGDRVVHREGDARASDLGTEDYDVVLLANLAHHLTDEQNRTLATRVTKALRPGGVFAVVEHVRPEPAGGVTQAGGLAEFFFGLTSRAGSWSAGEIAAWQRHAGLRPSPPADLGGGFSIQAAAKHRG